MNRILLTSFVLLLISAINKFEAKGQISVSSANGYSVNVIIQPNEIVPTSSSCQYGYNYNVKLNYIVSFSGTNIPSSLFTLQGYIGCGSATHFFSLPTSGGTGTLTTTSNVWRSQSDCATATVNSLGCNQVTLQIHGPGIGNRTVSFSVQTIPLPVRMVDFSAEAQKEKVKLQWSTATETNNLYFTAEKSADGIEWKAVKRINGAGNSSSLLNYLCYDENPINGTSYYRIKQTDIDGKATYSDIRQVKYTGSTSISVYPNPNDGNTISFKGISRPADVVMTVRDAAGSSVYSSTLSSNNAQLPVLKSGIYVISLVNKTNGEVNNLRYVKM